MKIEDAKVGMRVRISASAKPNKGRKGVIFTIAPEGWVGVECDDGGVALPAMWAIEPDECPAQDQIFEATIKGFTPSVP